MRFSLGHSTSQNPVSQHASFATKCSADDKSLKKRKKKKRKVHLVKSEIACVLLLSSRRKMVLPFAEKILPVKCTVITEDIAEKEMTNPTCHQHALTE